jgi:hypothetical protein
LIPQKVPNLQSKVNYKKNLKQNLKRNKTGKILPPEACYLPPYPPHLQSAISPNLQSVLSYTLSYAAAPGPVIMPLIVLGDDAKVYPDVQERTYAAITRAQRLKV